MPLAFRAFAYGVLPTIFAQALTLAVMLTPLLRPLALRRPWPFVGWVLLLTASLIAFPTALAFNTAVLVFVALVWAIRGSAPPGTTARVLAGVALALGLSIALYYGLYISSFITKTLPALTGGIGPGGKGWWFAGPGEMLGWTAGYLVNWLPYGLVPVAVAWLWLGWRGPRGASSGSDGSTARLAALMAAWLLVLLGGMLLNLRFDLIGKHLYYTMPAAAIAAGALFGALWNRSAARGLGRWLAVLCTLSIAWAALSFLVTRL
jgi:hypothetical protein